MNWTIEQLIAFVTAAEQGSFSAAGRALGRAQSVVSTHVSMLEDSLGLELFDRSSRSPVLTDAGKDLLPEAHAVLRQSHRFESFAIAQFKGEAAKLNIALGHGVPFQGVARVVSRLSQRYPFVTGECVILDSKQVQKNVAEGTSHVGLVLGEIPQTGDHCEQVCVGQMRFCLVASRQSSLATVENVTEHDLAQHRQIIVKGAHARRYLLSAQYWEVNDVLSALYWASLGIGWAAAPYHLVQHVLQDSLIKDLVLLNTDILERTAFNLFLIWNMKFKRRDVMEFFVKEMQTSYFSGGGKNF